MGRGYSQQSWITHHQSVVGRAKDQRRNDVGEEQTDTDSTVKHTGNNSTQSSNLRRRGSSSTVSSQTPREEQTHRKSNTSVQTSLGKQIPGKPLVTQIKKTGTSVLPEVPKSTTQSRVASSENKTENVTKQKQHKPVTAFDSESDDMEWEDGDEHEHETDTTSNNVEINRNTDFFGQAEEDNNTDEDVANSTEGPTSMEVESKSLEAEITSVKVKQEKLIEINDLLKGQYEELDTVMPIDVEIESTAGSTGNNSDPLKAQRQNGTVLPNGSQGSMGSSPTKRKWQTPGTNVIAKKQYNNMEATVSTTVLSEEEESEDWEESDFDFGTQPSSRVHREEKTPTSTTDLTNTADHAKDQPNPPKITEHGSTSSRSLSGILKVPTVLPGKTNKLSSSEPWYVAGASHGRQMNNPKSTGTKVHFKNQFVLSTSAGDKSKNALRERGLHMADVSQKVTTPVKVEYNTAPDELEFNVFEKTKQLLELFISKDNQLRILDVDKNIVLYEHGTHLPEGVEFETLFKLRQQAFRKGHRKFTVYFVVESTITIQRLKYMDPIKNFIFDQNIWVKPDLYLTQIESSPGFFTLLHPKITNRLEYTKKIIHAIEQTPVDLTEEIVQKWHETNGMVANDMETNIPSFHLEPSIKKWGKIQTEILKVICSAEDADYVKFLLSTVSDTEYLERGLFVPAGLHLLEGKDLVSRLLLEHKTFMADTTSIQIDGISQADMDRYNEGFQSTLMEYILKIPGVSSVEPTYFTTSRGQWLLVIKTKDIPNIKHHFEAQLANIY